MPTSLSLSPNQPDSVAIFGKRRVPGYRNTRAHTHISRQVYKHTQTESHNYMNHEHISTQPPHTLKVHAHTDTYTVTITHTQTHFFFTHRHAYTHRHTHTRTGRAVMIASLRKPAGQVPLADGQCRGSRRSLSGRRRNESPTQGPN